MVHGVNTHGPPNDWTEFDASQDGHSIRTITLESGLSLVETAIIAAEKTNNASLVSDPATGAPYFGHTTDFVSYTWHQITFHTFSECLLRGVVEGGVTTASEDEHGDDDRLLWIDMFAVTQNMNTALALSHNAADLNFEEVILACRRVVAVLVPWSNPSMLGRCWCLREVQLALSNGKDFVVAMRQEERGSLAEAAAGNLDSIFATMVALIDTKKATATRTEDQERIHEQITSSVGYEEVNLCVLTLLMAWLHKMAGKGVLPHPAARKLAETKAKQLKTTWADPRFSGGNSTISVLEDGQVMLGGSDGIIIGGTDEHLYAKPMASAGNSKAKRKHKALAKSAAKVDELCPDSGSAIVIDGFNCMMNQTNSGMNLSKFYKIQMLGHPNGLYSVWTRWGRVGEQGQAKYNTQNTGRDEAEKAYNKVFKDKNKKYTVVELEEDESAAAEMAEALGAAADGDAVTTAPCSLDGPTKDLVELIFNKDMFKSAMTSFNIDVKKMPLGALSQAQINRGYDALLAVENAVKTNRPRTQIETLSDAFYTVIPHNFGRNRPTALDSLDLVKQKIDMLDVLSDIEKAQELLKTKAAADPSTVSAKNPSSPALGLIPPPPGEPAAVPVGLTSVSGASQVREHATDVNFRSLTTDLSLVLKQEDEFKLISTYASNTMARKVRLLDVWRVNRHGEDTRFCAHDAITNRKLLWHGTNFAVVAAIMKGGLRIMPHAGGRVGKGLYLASENGKSANYVGTAAGLGVNMVGTMFLVEAALGNEYNITRDDSSLQRAPVRVSVQRFSCLSLCIRTYAHTCFAASVFHARSRLRPLRAPRLGTTLSWRAAARSPTRART